ncbi:MAG: helix-turn-helix transcriptional regulator [Firmicutes bacterium]|nr:helix-turn-helix transcriptional regulator [Bacillota bacterium]
MSVQKAPRCEVTAIHGEIVAKVKEKMPSEEVLANLAGFFKVFGDATRVRILYALFQSELCVCDIAYLLQMSQSAISHQLRTLKQAKLVKFRKEGRVVYYSLDDHHIQAIFEQSYQHILEKN